MPKGGRRPGAGRPVGSRTRRVIERQLLASVPYVDGSARLAKDVLDELMMVFRRLAIASCKAGEWTAFVRYSNMAADCAKELLPFQEPRLSAITTVAHTPQQITRFQLNIFSGPNRIPVELPTEIKAIENHTIERQSDNHYRRT